MRPRNHTYQTRPGSLEDREADHTSNGFYTKQCENEYSARNDTGYSNVLSAKIIGQHARNNPSRNYIDFQNRDL